MVPPPEKPQGAPAEPDLGRHGEIAYGLVVLLFNLFPSLAFAVVPGGELQGKTEDFLFVYLTTLPLSGSLTVIFLMFGREWLDTPQERLWAAFFILVGCAVFAGAVQASQGLEFLQAVHGPPLVYLGAIVLYVLASYAFVYGFPLYLAAFAAAAWAAYWLDHKLPRTSSSE